MSVTSGFFNSLNGDRRYNAEQMSSLFNGIINDGVFANIGTAFAVNAGEGGTSVIVGIGRAWFNSTWINNDALLTVGVTSSEVLLDRYDAVVIEVNHSDAVRAATVKMVTGVPDSEPVYPEMVHTDYVNQYPLAYIYRKAGVDAVTQADITNKIGTSDCPYITGILQVQNIDKIVAQWEAEWNQWYLSAVTQGNTDLSTWMTDTKADFNEWFASLQAVLEPDVATNLASKIVELQERFKILAIEKCIYFDLEGSDGNPILDSDGNVVQGKTVFGSGDEQQMAEIEAKIEDMTSSLMPKSGGTFTGNVYFADGDQYGVDENANAEFASVSAATITGDKVYGAVWNDYAEWFERGEDTEPGDIIALDTDGKEEKYVKADLDHPCVVGVHSNEYSHIIGGKKYATDKEYFSENLKNYIPVGLAGRCRVKVKDEVKPGDMIVPSDIPGVGEKYDSKKNTMDMVLGRAVALEERKDGIRFVKVLLR